MEIKKKNLELKIEAVLFSYGDWISLNDISKALGEEDIGNIKIKNSLLNLKKKFEENNFSFKIEENETRKWRMALKGEFEGLVSDLISSIEIPQKVLKVLSVIAYEQPITKTRLADILGKSVKKEVGYLYINKFLSYEKSGNGKYYKVTKKFFDYFKLDEDENFKSTADKNINVFLEEPLELNGKN